MTRFDSMIIAAQNALANSKAEVYVDKGVMILTCLVVGSLLLAALLYSFNGIIIPDMNKQLEAIFNNKPSLPSGTPSAGITPTTGG